MVFGSLVVLYVWLHSCLCFSLLEKLFLKTCSTPPQHQAICWAFKFFFLSQSRHLLDTWWIDWESSYLLDSFSTARSIDRAFVLDMVVCSLTYSLHLYLSTTIFSTPTSIDVSTPSSVEIYWWPIYSPHTIRISFLSIFLSIPLTFHLPNLSHSLQTSSSRFLQVFSKFSSLGKLLISHIHAFHVLKPRIWGFWKILGFFKIVEFLLKFWDGF